MRTIDDVLAEGRVQSALLLAADRAGDTAEVERLHGVMQALQKEIFALDRLGAAS